MVDFRDGPFGAGADARLAGLPLARNPFDPRADARAWLWWRLGWADVDRFWGTEARPNRAVPPLPKVLEVIL